MRQNTEADFWPRVKIGAPNECWPWTRARVSAGYGAFNLRGKQWVTSRLAWTLTYGEIPEGYFICHHCDNPPCCNPAHLFAGTCSDNSVDMWNKGRAGLVIERHREWARAITHCPAKHEYTPENTYIYPDGRRKCRACEAVRAAEAQQTEKRKAQKREAQRRYRQAHPDKIVQMRQDYAKRQREERAS